MLIGRKAFNTGMQSILGIQGGGGIKSIQSVTGTIPNASASANLTLSEAVDTSNTMLIGGSGLRKIATHTDDSCSWSLTGSTTVQLVRDGSSGESRSCTIYVIEFQPNIINSVSQYTVTFVSADTADDSATKTITSVDTNKSIILPLGVRWSGANVFADPSDLGASPEYQFNSSTQIEMFHPNLGTIGTAVTVIYGFAVVEFIV